jgi:hypothetical protein
LEIGVVGEVESPREAPMRLDSFEEDGEWSDGISGFSASETQFFGADLDLAPIEPDGLLAQVFPTYYIV